MFSWYLWKGWKVKKIFFLKIFTKKVFIVSSSRFYLFRFAALVSWSLKHVIFFFCLNVSEVWVTYHINVNSRLKRQKQTNEESDIVFMSLAGDRTWNMFSTNLISVFCQSNWKIRWKYLNSQNESIVNYDC